MPITPLPTPPSTSDPANFDSRADAFLGALPDFATEANALAASLNNISTTSESSTELTISAIEQTLTVEADKSYEVGQSVKIASTADGSKWMIGDVQSYNSTTGELVVDVQATQSTGTFSAWTVTLSFNGQIATGQLQNVLGTSVQAYDADTAKTDIAQEYTAGQRSDVPTVSAVSDTFTPDMDDANWFEITLDGSDTLANPANLTAGQSGVIYITKTAGTDSLAYGTYWPSDLDDFADMSDSETGAIYYSVIDSTNIDASTRYPVGA